MSQFLKSITNLFITVVLFAGIILTGSLTSPSLAAITPQEAKNIIQDSNSVQEAGSRLKASDSSEKVRNREPLNTAKEVTDRIKAQDQDRDRRDDLIGTTQEKLKDAAENVKEKLNLDEPLAPSTKEFLGKRSERVDAQGNVIVREEPGYYQRDRETRVYVEK